VVLPIYKGKGNPIECGMWILHSASSLDFLASNFAGM